MHNPIFQAKKYDEGFLDEGMWYFWDETWSYLYGPYGSEFTAAKMLALYTKVML